MSEICRYTSREDLRATVAKALEHNVRTSDGMNWNLQDLVYEALSEEWRKRDGEDDDPWENHGPDGYQPPSYEPVNPERIPTIHEGYASREMEKRGGRGDLCEENRRIQALNRLLDALRAMIGRLSDQAQGILTAVKRRQRPSGAPQAPSSPEPAERPQERPQARETPPQAPQEPPKPIRTKKALTDRFKTRLDERLAENERKQAEKQAEPDMEETWDLSDPADPLNIGMGWGTGGHGLGL